MDLGVAGKHYIIVGGSRGMGHEAARVLAADGAKLSLVSRGEENLRSAASAIREAYGVEALAVVGDASDWTSINTAFDAAVRSGGAPRGVLITTGLPSGD